MSEDEIDVVCTEESGWVIEGRNEPFGALAVGFQGENNTLLELLPLNHPYVIRFTRKGDAERMMNCMVAKGTTLQNLRVEEHVWKGHICLTQAGPAFKGLNITEDGDMSIVTTAEGHTMTVDEFMKGHAKENGHLDEELEKGWPTERDVSLEEDSKCFDISSLRSRNRMISQEELSERINDAIAAAKADDEDSIQSPGVMDRLYSLEHTIVKLRNDINSALTLSTMDTEAIAKYALTGHCGDPLTVSAEDLSELVDPTEIIETTVVPPATLNFSPPLKVDMTTENALREAVEAHKDHGKLLKQQVRFLQEELSDAKAQHSLAAADVIRLSLEKNNV